jgi:hypothetical protein
MAFIVAGTAVMVGIGTGSAFAATGGQPTSGPTGGHPTGRPPVACSITEPVPPGTLGVPGQPVHTAPTKPVPPGTPGVPAQPIHCWIITTPVLPGTPSVPATPIGRHQ